MMLTLLEWALFHLVIGVLLVIDLGVLQRRAHAPSLREAAAWSAVWIAAAGVFGVFVYLILGGEATLHYGAAYAVEKMLSVDNLFVFAVIFRYFGVDYAYQHKVLFWGIIGAILTRAFFIVAGIALLEAFSWMIYVFGAVLLYSGYKLGRSREMTDPGKNIVVRYASRLLPVTPRLHGDKFFVKGSRVMATPLLLTLIAIESTDIVFAIDSVPAVLAITTELFVAYTSNIFAVLGLRALYFLLIQLLMRMRYLNLGLSVLLVYLGLKMILTDLVHIPTTISLAVVGAILGLIVASSLLSKRPVSTQE